MGSMHNDIQDAATAFLSRQDNIRAIDTSRKEKRKNDSFFACVSENPSDHKKTRVRVHKLMTDKRQAFLGVFLLEYAHHFSDEDDPKKFTETLHTEFEAHLQHIKNLDTPVSEVDIFATSTLLKKPIYILVPRESDDLSVPEEFMWKYYPPVATSVETGEYITLLQTKDLSDKPKFCLILSSWNCLPPNATGMIGEFHIMKKASVVRNIIVPKTIEQIDYKYAIRRKKCAIREAMEKRAKTLQDLYSEDTGKPVEVDDIHRHFFDQLDTMSKEDFIFLCQVLIFLGLETELRLLVVADCSRQVEINQALIDPLRHADDSNLTHLDFIHANHDYLVKSLDFKVLEAVFFKHRIQYSRSSMGSQTDVDKIAMLSVLANSSREIFIEFMEMLKKHSSDTYLHVMKLDGEHLKAGHKAVDHCFQLYQLLERFEDVYTDVMVLSCAVIDKCDLLVEKLIEQRGVSNLATILGSSTGVVGTILVAVGILAVPVTGGASLGVIIAGTVLGFLGGGTSAGAKIREYIKQRKRTNELGYEVGQLSNGYSELDLAWVELYDAFEVSAQSRLRQPRRIDFVSKKLGLTIGSVLRTFKGLYAIPFAAVRLASVPANVLAAIVGPLSLAIDLFFLSEAAHNMRKGSKTVASEHIAEIKEFLSAQLLAFHSIIRGNVNENDGDK